jgi:hypothetical protein
VVRRTLSTPPPPFLDPNNPGYVYSSTGDKFNALHINQPYSKLFYATVEDITNIPKQG